MDQNGRARLYVDGVVDETDFSYNRSNLVLQSTSVGALFRVAAANYFSGSVDELALWTRPLTWTEIQQLRTTGVPAPAPRIPPTISQQPISSTNRLGDRVTLTVLATGSSPLTFQWRKDGVPIAGQTFNTLSLFLTAPATNDYSVLVSNVAGSAPSDVVRVTVLPDPIPEVSSGLFYYWPLDTVNASPTPSSPDLYSHADLLLNGLDSANLTPGQLGNALAFSGGQYAARNGGMPIYLTTNFTVSLWVNGFPQIDARVFAEGSTLSGLPLFTIGTDNAGATPSADVFIRTDSGGIPINHRKSTRPVFDGAWHHLVWVDQNGKARLFIDGVPDETDFSYTRGPVDPRYDRHRRDLARRSRQLLRGLP